MSARRIGALLLRHLYVWRRHWPAWTDLFYWPLLDLMVFGFLATYLARSQNTPMFLGLLLGALILWDLFFRIQQGISVSFLQEMWTRNLLNLFVSPLAMTEFLAAMMLFGLIKIAITATMMAAVAWGLYEFDFFTLGPALWPLAVGVIVFGWAVGTVVTAILLRFGPSAETLAWSLAFLFQPFGAVFYPLSVFPEWLRPALGLLPLTHVFEAMRAVLGGGGLDAGRIAWIFVLDAVYLVGAFAVFAVMFRGSMARGALLKAQD
ncbi:MAG: ABC transporter permease [Armatimonadetes bacterium]|nr:ABC transporter permease [Armatimonadota bacterium]